MHNRQVNNFDLYYSNKHAFISVLRDFKALRTHSPNQGTIFRYRYFCKDCLWNIS